MSSVRKRVFTGTSTAPICMIANIAWSHSGRLTIQSATLSPGAMPSCEQSLRGGVDACVELGERPALSLEGERLARAPQPSRALGQEPDRLLLVPVPHDPLRLPGHAGWGRVYSRACRKRTRPRVLRRPAFWGYV